MIRLIACLLALTILQVYSQERFQNDNDATNPGFAVRVTKKTFDRAIEFGMKVLSEYLKNLQIPEFEETFFVGSRMKMSGTNLTRMDKPEIKIRFIENREICNNTNYASAFCQDILHQLDASLNETINTNQSYVTSYVKVMQTDRGVRTTWHDQDFNPGNTNEGVGGINVEVSGLNADAETHAEILLKFFFFGSKENFDASMVLRNGSVSLSVNVGEENGMFKLASIECQAEGDIKIAVNGTVSENVLNYLLDSNFVQGYLFGKICESVTDLLRDNFQRNVPHNMISVVENFPSLSLDYSLTEAPIFRTDYLETRHIGTFQPTNNSLNWPFRPNRMYHLTDTSRMLYFYVTDYTLNTLWQSFYHGGHLKWTLTHRQIEEFILNPSSAAVSRYIVDFLRKINPNRPTDIEIEVNSPPYEVFKLSGRKLAITINAKITFFDVQNSRSKILELDTFVNCESETIVSTKLSFEITHLNTSSTITYAAPNLSREELSSDLRTITTPAFEQILKDFGRAGTANPFQFGLENLHIFEDTAGFCITAIDIDVQALSNIFANPI